MPDHVNYKVIYSNDNLVEYDKYSLYVILLEMNQKFANDIKELRAEYSIDIDSRSPNDAYKLMLLNPQFIESTKRIAHNIKIQGDWVGGLIEYVCGFPAQASLYPSAELHRIEATAVTDTDEPHVVLKVYGDIPLEELQSSSKHVRDFISSNMNYANVKNLNHKTLTKILTIHHLKDTLNYKNISLKLYELGYPLQDYASIRRQYSEYKKYADRLY